MEKNKQNIISMFSKNPLLDMFYKGRKYKTNEYYLMKATGKLAKIRKNRKAKGYKCRTTLKDLM